MCVVSLPGHEHRHMASTHAVLRPSEEHLGCRFPPEAAFPSRVGLLKSK